MTGGLFWSALELPRAEAKELTGAVESGDRSAFVISTETTKHCGTCEFSGGPRRLFADKKSLSITGLGCCNNLKNPMFRDVTTPDHGPMDTWRKWGALG